MVYKHETHTAGHSSGHDHHPSHGHGDHGHHGKVIKNRLASAMLDIVFWGGIAAILAVLLVCFILTHKP